MSRLLHLSSTTRWAFIIATAVAADGVAAHSTFAQSGEPDPSNRQLATVVTAERVAARFAHAQPGGPHTANRRWFIGSSLFIVANVVAEDPPSYYQLNIGRWLTQRDTVSLEVITWRYAHPLGIPYGSSFGADAERYPGRVRGTGAGVAYQRYWWRGLYSAIHATALRQDYQGPDGRPGQRGFQLFTALRLGYHIEFFNRRLFLEPSLAVTHWPITTNTPAAFRALDDRWPSYFIGEPGLHFGVRF